MRKVLPIALMGVLALGVGAQAAVAADTTKSEKQKIVYDVKGKNKKQLMVTLDNIQNDLKTVANENFDVRVVLHDKGVALLQKAKVDPDLQSKLTNLKKRGIRFLVCANTLSIEKINYKKDLYGVSEQDIVPNGVVTISVLLAKGYSYAKPSENDQSEIK